MKPVLAFYGLALAAATASFALAAPVAEKSNVANTAKPAPVRLAQAAPAKDPFGLPILEGYELTVTKCSACHDTSTFASARHTKDEWGDVIGQMIGRGADVSDADFPKIQNYLFTAFPR